jgi:TolB protein
MDLNAMDDLLDRVRGARRMPAALQGRLAFYHPRTRSIEIVDAFVPGTIPCSFSPDRSRLLVATRRRGTPRLFQYSLERRDLAPAVSGHGFQIDGSYGPDGRIAFAGNERRSERLRLAVWVTEEGGAAPSRLTVGPSDSRVAWSPDGSTLLVQSPGRDGREIIRAFDMTSSESVPRLVARGREPAFSPRGDWVVYSRQVDDGWRLWRMRPDGTGKTALGHRPQGEADERYPAVSPDGRYVAYAAERDGRRRIRIRGMDGSGDRLLIEDADGTQPVW